MGEILRILEGPIAPMICATEGEMTEICGFLASCRIKYLWAKVRDAVAHTIDTMTLAEMVGSADQERVGANPTPTPSQFIAISDIRVTHPSTN
jgi:Rrf2 family transcriptional regulator, cysteine metabolism repressor